MRAYEEEDFAARRSLLGLFEQSGGCGVIAAVEGALGLVEGLTPGDGGNQKECGNPEMHFL